MKKRLAVYFVVLFIILFVVSMQLISASIELGNLSYEIDASYTKSQLVRGWVNISLKNEPLSSLVSGFNKEITIKEFLDKNNLVCSIENAQCSCTPKDCEPTFSTIGSKGSVKSYQMKFLSTKLFGVRISDNISQIREFKFNVSTNAQTSCINPIMIDLLDNGIDWKENPVSEEECAIEKPYGCYNSNDKAGDVEIGTDKLCEKINLPPARGFKIGANVNGTGSETFTMGLEAGAIGKTCTISVSSGGKISCNIVIDGLEDYIDADVCIYASKKTSYKINFEDINSCGYLLQSNGEKFSHDYEVFAIPLKYTVKPNFAFDQKLFTEETNLSRIIFDYIDRKYNKECSPYCIVPVRIYSGTMQQITISNLLMKYEARGHGLIENGFYDINETSALINSDFLKLDLGKAGILAPSTTGEKTLTLKIGNLTISQKISVLNIPRIKEIIPNKVPLSTPTTFIVILDPPDSRNLTYNWEFGDGAVLTTRENKALHTYTKNATYNLKVTLSSNVGETSKTITVSVGATYSLINNTINEYKKRIKDINDKLAVFPEFVSNRIKATENIDDLKSNVERIEKNFREAFQTDYDKLMQELLDLKIPEKLETPLIIKPAKFFQNKDRLNTLVIGELGAGTVDESKEESYYNAINNWLENNLEITFESKTYTFYFTEQSEQTQKDLFSDIKLTLTPKNNIEEFYLVIDGKVNEIKFKEDYREKEIENGFGLRFSELTPEQKIEIEFLYPGKIDILNLPVYLSPKFKDLELEEAVAVCNNNNICEKDLKENYKNCRADCKPIKLTIIYFVILFVIVLIVYIILQEWYKRYYENYLFKDRNQLFNLITFMSNSLNQKLSKNDIFEKLKNVGWTVEQVNYAWKKLYGKRTGMWEIPIFKMFENKKVKEEIAKRKVLSSASLLRGS